VLFGVTVADWDDYVDPTFNCPATTTCPVVCAYDISYCPPDLMACEATSEGNSTLCADGSCSPGGQECDPELESPCEYDCAWFACRKVINKFDQCNSDYEEYYTYMSECAAEEVENIPKVSWTNQIFLACYVWMAVVTVAVFGWCVFNQRLFPRKKESTKSLEEAIEEGKPLTPSLWIQTAYCRGLVGDTLYAISVMTLWGFQILLAILSIMYYQQQELIVRWTPVMLDEKQILLAFEIVWMVGIVWSLCMKWPFSVHTIFLRRCKFSQATHVMVFAPYAEDTNKHAEVVDRQLKLFVNVLFCGVNFIMSILFNDVNRPAVPGTYDYCRVDVDDDGNRSFYFRLRLYVYDSENELFVPGSVHVGGTIGQIIESKHGLTAHEVHLRRNTVGPNYIRMRKPNFFVELFKEFNKPFYVYQNYLVWTWVPLWYYHMAIVETIVRLAGGVVVAFFQYRNMMNLYRISNVTGDVQVLRDNEVFSIPQQEIVPGDVIYLEAGTTYCDTVIISGHNVLVDESAITGEATLIAKSELNLTDESKTYNPTEQKKHTILAGTKIMEVGNKSLAVVTKTGSFTAKGELLRGVLSYQRHMFKFDFQVYFVLCILVLYAIFGFVLVVYLLQDDPVYGWFYGMFVVATAIPPLLPTVFVVSVGISNNRLNSKRIVCTNPEDLLVSGKIRLACFDKTGTLTKQGLDFLSVHPYDNKWGETTTRPTGVLATGMAMCHSLATSSDGQLVGNLVDQNMFIASDATLKVSKDGSTCVTTSDGTNMTALKHFDFDQHRMTQSVIVRDDDSGKLQAYVKGSAESIKKLCNIESLPSDFDETSKACSREGIYQIAMAVSNIPLNEGGGKEFSSGNIVRDNIEKNLDFVGFINFKNMLNEDTATVLKELREGGVRSIMITGDSVLTGIHIAKECGLIAKDKKVILGSHVNENGKIVWVNDINDSPVSPPSLKSLNDPKSKTELAVTGAVWSVIMEESFEYANELAKFVRVYGRCTPNEKVSIVSHFVDSGIVTLMCGDGGNDIGALKRAHIGIALSEAEASTVASFTSLDKSIASVLHVLKEGRCALASAFSSYKYMIMYGQIAFINQVAAAYFYVTFSGWSWIFIDGIWVLSLALSLPLAKAAKKLSKECPTSSLLGTHTMSSVLGILIINALTLVVAMAILFKQDWFLCRKWGSTDVSNISVISDNYEAEVIFIVTGYQFISSACAYNFGFTHRSPWIRNYIFVILVVGFTVVHFIATLHPSRLSCFFRVNCTNKNVVLDEFWELIPIVNPFNTTEMPTEFRWILFVIVVANLILNMSFEYFFVNGILKKITRRRKKEKRIDGQSNKGQEDVFERLEASRNCSGGFEIMQPTEPKIGGGYTGEGAVFLPVPV